MDHAHVIRHQVLVEKRSRRQVARALGISRLTPSTLIAAGESVQLSWQSGKELLQQLGYRDVTVTKRSNDGGIDGYGNFQQGVASIKSAFQAKRRADTPVRRPEIDRLRGALQGEFDHGVFITTSRFTKDATEASFKKGAISILLLDGDAVAELMIDRGIGVTKRPLYLYEVDDEFSDFVDD